MASTEGIKVWPMSERVDRVRAALNESDNPLEELEAAFECLNGDCDPADVAEGSAPIELTAIGVFSEFVKEQLGTVTEIASTHARLDQQWALRRAA